jgi:glyoxylase-like metal-dependent hydrolase (beta-lactamase superfamily II)
MPIVLALATAILLVLAPLPASAQDAGMTLDAVSKALGADDLTSILYTGSGAVYAVGQSAAPGLAWPQFNLKSLTRSVNYDTASLRDEQVRTQALKPPRGGDVQPIRGEQWLDSLVSGGFAWNIVLGRPSNAPMTLAERQFRLWSTPHGVIKAAHIYRASVQGRTIAFKVPGRFRLKATVGDDNLISKVEGLIPDPLVGDLAVEIIYSEYRNFDGVMFPMRIREKSGGFPSLDLTVSDVRPNLPVVIQALPVIRQAFDPAGRVVRQKVADGVWYLTGGTYHSVVIEMKDHLIVVEAPLNEEHAMALLAETRKLVPGKPIRYVINTHHHYDHAGGLRTFVAEGITVITHEINKAFLEQALAAPATVRPDRQMKAARKPIVEGVRDRRTLTDGARIVELYHIAGNLHDDGMLMVYLPQEKLLSEADAYSPPLRNATPPMPPSPVTVNLVDNIARLGLDVGILAPLHGRLVPLAELYLAIGKNP